MEGSGNIFEKYFRILIDTSLSLAGYAWAHNNVSYFQHYHEGKEIGYWFIITAIVGGCFGVFAGGYISDLVVTRLGVHSRLWLLGVCTVIPRVRSSIVLIKYI